LDTKKHSPHISVVSYAGKRKEKSEIHPIKRIIIRSTGGPVNIGREKGFYKQPTTPKQESITLSSTILIRNRRTNQGLLRPEKSES